MCAEASTVLRTVAADFWLSIGNVLKFLCWKWKPYPRVVFRKSDLFECCFIYEEMS
jgi:hypothetical protein